MNCSHVELRSVAGAVAVSPNRNRVRCPVLNRHPDRNAAAVTAVVSDPKADLLFDKWQNREGLAYRYGPNAAVALVCDAAVTEIDGPVSAMRGNSDWFESIGRLVPVVYHPIGLSLTVQPERAVSSRETSRTLPSPKAPSSNPPLMICAAAGDALASAHAAMMDWTTRFITSPPNVTAEGDHEIVNTPATLLACQVRITTYQFNLAPRCR